MKPSDRKRVCFLSSETAEQEFVFQWAALQQIRIPALKFMYHIPNEGKRTKSGGAQMKRMGLKCGVPDICLPFPNGKYHALYIEMKYGNNGTTKEQENYLNYLGKAGYAVSVCRSGEDAVETIKAYLGVR